MFSTLNGASWKDTHLYAKMNTFMTRQAALLRELLAYNFEFVKKAFELFFVVFFF